VPMTIMRLLMGISFELRSTYYEVANSVNAPRRQTRTQMREEFSPRRTRRARSSELLFSKTFVSFVIFAGKVTFLRWVRQFREQNGTQAWRAMPLLEDSWIPGIVDQL